MWWTPLKSDCPNPEYLYEQSVTLLSSQVDANRRLRLSSMFTLIQEAGIAHTTALGVGREKTLDRGLLWVIALQRTIIHALPVYDDTIHLLSWPGKTMHLLFPRYTRLTASDGTVLTESSAIWALMDAQSRKLIFPEEYDIALPGTVTGLEIPLPGHLRPLEDGQSRTFTVPYSFLDLNGHMNNTRYFDLAEDLMPSDMRVRTPSALQVSYNSEARLGDELTLRYRCSKDCFCLSGEREKNIFHLRIDYPAS